MIDTHFNDPNREPLARDLISRAELFAAAGPDQGAPRRTDIAELSILRCPSPTPLEATLYRPSLCLILQGAKDVYLGTRRLPVVAGHSVVVSHHLPIVARVTEASDQQPFLAMVLDLDLSTVRSLSDELDGGPAERKAAARSDGHCKGAVESPAGALEIAPRDSLLLGAMSRLFELLDRPTEIAVMAPLILREVHFRLLLANHGAMLRQLVHRRSHASRIADAIAWIRENSAEPIVVRELARIAGMSQSTFHEHFKALTATTPLQYQKDIRLLAARELLRDGEQSVSGAAFEVGYESPSQFSREYARKFGRPPSQDLAGSTAVGELGVS